MPCGKKEEIKFSVVKEITMQQGKKSCPVGSKDNVTRGRGVTQPECPGAPQGLRRLDKSSGKEACKMSPLDTFQKWSQIL